MNADLYMSSFQSNKKEIPVLMYHSISDHINPQVRQFTIPPMLFREHMEYLYYNNYTSITITELMTLNNQERQFLPEKPVVLTFDDGFTDFFTDAFPILKHYNFVATLYIVTGFVGDTSRWLWREGDATRPLLTWDQIREVAAWGIECGGHSHTHPQLDLLPLSTARHEIMRCKELLELHLGQTIFSFAYPYGYHSTALQRLVKKIGYTSGCAVEHEMSVETDNPFCLPRLFVGPETDIPAFAQLLTSSSPSVMTKLCKQVRAPIKRFIRQYSSIINNFVYYLIIYVNFLIISTNII